MTTRLLREAISQLQDDLDVETQDIAGALDTTPRTVERWLREGIVPQRNARQRLDELFDLRDDLYRSLEHGRLVRQWLHSDSRYLGLVKPVEVLRAGRIDRVKAALLAMDEGAFV